MQELIYLFLTFILYSFIGWILECILSIIETKKFINRGFLIGPYCPIYGVGSICLIYALRNYVHDTFAIFIIGTAICSFIEYVTSYTLEKIFKARWWDYSNMSFNVNGRICLSYSFLFGIGGLFIIRFNPYLQNIIRLIPNSFLYIGSILIFIAFTVDMIISFNVINKLKLAASDLKADNTEEISEKVMKALRKKSGQFKRLFQAFPNVKIYLKKRPKN